MERVERPYEGPDRRKRERRTPQREAATSKTRAAKPYAPLVAQVIATSLGLSQTRSRRRASVAEALKAYEKDEDPPPETRGLV